MKMIEGIFQVYLPKEQLDYLEDDMNDMRLFKEMVPAGANSIWITDQSVEFTCESSEEAEHIHSVIWDFFARTRTEQYIYTVKYAPARIVKELLAKLEAHSIKQSGNTFSFYCGGIKHQRVIDKINLLEGAWV